MRFISPISDTDVANLILSFDNQRVRLKQGRGAMGDMATTTSEEPELKHWLGILLVIILTAVIGALIPTVLYLL